MFLHSKKYRKILSIICVLVIIIAVFTNLKWIGKFIYPLYYEDYIKKYSYKYNIDPILVASIIKVESKYYKEAKSYRGAKGLMQISPITGRWAAKEIGILNYNEDCLYDPEINIMIGCWYLNKLKKQFDNDIKLVLTAYNGGSGNVEKWLKNPIYSSDGRKLDEIPFIETKQYVKKVLKTYKIYKFLYKDILIDEI
ncbi:lytic transglycosylase domain-containing protein [Caloranaerobacter azorensis]|uniref:Lytic transglycosylase domain-containing protein n=1 Tax=Caloranaerobacter azorensis TaxID=116090 RepID=A0A6P1YFR5_9FIRM|nr:lytic transglycosylase domain-containing protein [Caloranaerobacter azorensis]